MPRNAFDRQDPEVATHQNHPGGGFGPLFEKPVPYQRFSDTSRDAAKALEPSVGDLRRLVLEAYEKAGQVGLSADQAAATLSLSILAVRPRVTELFMDGVLVKTGRRVANASGQTARVLIHRKFQTTPSKGAA